MALLDDQPLCGHSALETLIRIVIERRIRGGFELVRGREPVVCWSSHPPPEFCSLRRWNPALMRWTVEPYGVAVSRDFLKCLGAKPAVYGGDKTYRKLPDSEKFRFQTSAGAVAWKTEREWRSPGDLQLDGIGNDAWFAFVPDGGEIERISEITGHGLRVVAFNEGCANE